MFGLTTIDLFLAYGGLILHILIKLGESPLSLTESFNKKTILITISSIIAIPILLIICSDTSMKDILPITHVTAFLAGYQTQSFLRSVGSIGDRLNKNKNN
jgi:hypothetical protein